LLRKNGRSKSEKYDPNLPSDVYEVLLSDDAIAFWPTNRSDELPARLMNPLLPDALIIKTLLRKNVGMGRQETHS
jgi:hypothetical protein